MRFQFAALAVAAALALPVQAQDVAIGPNDSVQSVLTAQKGKRVSLRLRGGGQELTGVVREVNARVAVIGALTGREFFDAVIALDAVEAVVIRTKQ
jgi:hypothetical protein